MFVEDCWSRINRYLGKKQKMVSCNEHNKQHSI